MDKDFDIWNVKKKEIQQVCFDDFIHEREVWWCSIGMNIGYEQDGKNDFFERPILVLKKYNRDQILAVPITSRIKNTPYHMVFEHNGQRYAAIISQIRVVSTKRMRRRMHLMSSAMYESIRRAVKDSI